MASMYGLTVQEIIDFTKLRRAMTIPATTVTTIELGEWRKLAAGNCYQMALCTLEGLARAPALPLRAMRLCHGIPTLKKPPYGPFGHAWVEVELPDGRMGVFDHAMPGRMIERERYYEAGAIDPAVVKRYTLEEAKRLADEHKLWGPWDATIAAAPHAND